MMPIANIASCHELAVPAQVMQHVVNVESGSNPFAIGVVGAHLERQPQNLDEAVATARMLESQGYNYSLGIAQVNRTNFAKFGLDSYEKAFDVCPNLVAGTQILAQCYAQAGGDWGKAFSCYYSGNFAKGYEDGYVQKVFDSMNRSSSAISGQARATPIQLAQTTRTQPMTASEYLVRMRSSVIDNAGAAAVAKIAQNLMPEAQAIPSRESPTNTPPSALDIQAAAVAGTHLPANAAEVEPAASGSQPSALDIQAAAVAGTHLPAPDPAIPASPSNNDIFEPQVRGPNDPVAAPKQETAASQPGVDRADLRLGGHDDAFVF
ncbi:MULTISPECIES: lytic transglycosylase domain-containing protein [unclassified Dyella]|uniref:lytic transglycosylase domain-containing protein n=1 Tax=unclassified Dyella TaxID=2634549 RepID=UPI000C8298BE|nr:lytic transglycosylase domain-containing protein [Dyella sp.]